MQILILTASLPYPPASGGALRAYGIIQGLHQAGHHITLMAFGDDTQQTPLHDFCEQIITHPAPNRSKIQRIRDILLTNQADIAQRLYSPSFEALLREHLAQNHYDLIQFEGIEVACYLPIAKDAAPKSKLCFDTFNAEADLQRTIFDIDKRNLSRLPAAIYSYIQSKRIEQYEGNLCRMADVVIAVSPEDKAILGKYRNDNLTFVVPSGIFTEQYQTFDKPVSLKSPSLVFTGKMDYRPNVDAMLWFTEEIFSQIDSAHLIIVGQKPHARLQHLAEDSRIMITGWVDSVLPYLHAGDVYIAPLRMGSGTRLKLLEAMASGCAIVATPIAASGLGDVQNAMMIAETADDFASAIVMLLNDASKRAELSENAQNRVKAHYDWSVLIPRLLNAYEEAGIG